MYIIMYMTSDNEKGILEDGHGPALFADDTSAYMYINELMSQEQHPKFMWLRRLPYGDS